MSCSSLKNRFEEMKNDGNLNFNDAITLYNDLQGSLDAHRMELVDLQAANETARAEHLEQHIQDGERMLAEIHKMTLS
ncbi:hypothetical protein [Desulfuribacillus alkaliarsenatis]|uniref:DUF2524 domain-containing protein n=1 Tax=Desulfuribacillus alkaliarsenatis TaxID=766136 RepID=A0A1E5FYY7_9FIRM|nr:hypothetical protein [Desulfuribacillus alkaliarsenatis]OEF95711.1 hypothetical protein BHF68_11430 [Desulfuribacillus alkaliarsenatis]